MQWTGAGLVRTQTMKRSQSEAVRLNRLWPSRAITPGLLVTLLLFSGLGLASCAREQATGNSSQPIQTKGMDVYYGVVPAQLLLDHPSGHEEQRMHKGVPVNKGTHHLVVAVFDSRTRARITDASITGSATEPGQPTLPKPMQAMAFGDAVSYGNYFDMPNPGPYEMVVKISRPGSHEPAVARFLYRHPQVRRVVSVRAADEDLPIPQTTR